MPETTTIVLQVRDPEFLALYLDTGGYYTLAEQVREQIDNKQGKDLYWGKARGE